VWDLCAALLIALALSIALQTVNGLSWPYDGDHFRDIAQAQTARDGHPLADPFYAGEWVWYNPLVAWIVASGSFIVGRPPALVDVQGGPWLNLLAPIAFYIVCARTAGRRAAILALVLFLFVNCQNDPSLACATYSPWLFVATFTQALFLLGIVALDTAARARSDATAAMAGLVAGLTFLAHTAPALILGCVAVVCLPRRSLLMSGAVALCVASPFLWAIAVHYHLHVINSTPMAWAWPPVTLAGLPATLMSNALLLTIAGGGFFVVQSRVVRAWVVAAAVLTAYGVAREVVAVLPAVVPTFHFWRYLTLGAILLSSAAADRVFERLTGRFAVLVVPVLVATALAWKLPEYRGRFDLRYGRAVADARSPDLSAAAAFLHKSVPANAVVLGSRGLSLEVIGPAGRKVVGVNPNWSNPYVDDSSRIGARPDALGHQLRPPRRIRRAGDHLRSHACGRHGSRRVRGDGGRGTGIDVPIRRGVRVQPDQRSGALKSLHG